MTSLDNLVGKVHKEVSIPVPDEDKGYCLSILRQLCSISKTNDKFRSCI